MWKKITLAMPSIIYRNVKIDHPMKHFRTIIISILLAAVTIATVPAAALFPLAQAQTGGNSGSGNEVYCRNGSRDYVNFVSSVLDYNDFVEYWNDIFVRYNANMCLYQDVDGLLQRIEKIRKQIRQAFYSCDASSKTLAKTYDELVAELYFLRHYVDASKGQVLITNDKSLVNDFMTTFVDDKSFFTKEDAQVLLQKFTDKYQSREQSYLTCADPTWENLVQKWNEFESNVGGFGAVTQAGESISKQWDGVLDSPFERTGNLLGGLLDAKINGLDPATAWSDIASDLTKNTGTGYTFEQFTAAATQDAVFHQSILTRTQYLAQYQQAYQQSSGSIVKEVSDRLNTLKDTIEKTFPFIQKTADCTQGIIDRTCN